MKKKRIFRGVATALVTPLKDGEIDYGALYRLIEMQIESGVGALVIGGTTGEAATLSDTERYELYSFAKGAIGERVPLILGTGTNDTRVAISHTLFAKSIGADGALVVTPYYNKGTEKGILEHYKKIANSTDLPIIVYNVPSRTGVNLSLDLLYRLAECENIVGIKEAGDSADRLVHLSSLSDTLPLYAGNDGQIYTVLSLGGEGVISVISNLLPKETVEIVRLFDEGKREESLLKLQSLLPLIDSMFAETNPAPIKYALQRLSLCSGELRLPLSEIKEETKAKIDALLSRYA